MMTNKFKKLFENDKLIPYSKTNKRKLKKKWVDGKNKDLLKGQKVKEDIHLPVDVGDTVLLGRFKNKNSCSSN